jgi:hypothetical protein
VVPHHGTNWAALRLTAQIGRDAVLSESYGRGCRGGGRRVMSPLLRTDRRRRKKDLGRKRGNGE